MYCDTALIDEQARLAALHRLEVLDTAPEEPFENVVSLVRTVLGVPMAAVSLVDEHRQWFKARSGIDVSETSREVSFCTHAIQHRDPFIINDATKDARFCHNPLVEGAPGVRSYAGIPLRTSDGYNVGSLCAIDFRPREFSSTEVAMLTKFAQIVVDELELRRIAGRDQLTNALTRRAFVDRVGQEVERFHRYGRDASLVMIDLDHFKVINDTHGHPAGDAVLREIAALLEDVKRPSDVLGRLGGEEFGMLLPETDARSAMTAAERFRAAIAAASIDPVPGLHLTVTASFGIATLDCAISDAQSWFAAADAPLYAAKRGGRNRCVSAAEAL